MITERGEEFDLGVEQRFVGGFELVDEVLRALTTIEVVAVHDDERERKLLMVSGHLLPHFVFRFFAGTVVADHCEAYGVRFEWKRQVLSHWADRGRQPAGDDKGRSKSASKDGSRHLVS